MAQLPDKVSPGDIISSNAWNKLIDKCVELDARIVQLETADVGSGKPEIISPTPTDILRVGDELRIVGRNFGNPADNIVFIDTTNQVSAFKAGSNDELLILDIPFVQNVTENGRSVPLTVTNSRGFASTSFILRQPAVTIPTGALTVNLSESPPPEVPLVDGGSYPFVFTIIAATTLDEVYQLMPSVDLGWPARVVDSNDNLVDPQEIFITHPFSPTEPTVATVRVQVMIPEGTPAQTVGKLHLRVTSNRNPTGLTKTSDWQPLTVGSPAPEPERVTIDLDSAMPNYIVGQDLVLPPPSAGQASTVYANFKVIVPVAGNYSIQPITFTNDPNGRWAASPTGAASGIAMQPPQSYVSIKIDASAGAPDAAMVLTVVSDDTANDFGHKDQIVRVA